MTETSTAADLSRSVQRRRSSRILNIAVYFAVSALGHAAQVTQRVSVDSAGVQGNIGGDLPWPLSVVSGDGRFVAFFSVSSNLVPGDTNGKWDVFVRDRLLGTTERVSIASSGAQGNANSGLFGIAISGDGRYVAFESRASNMVPGDTNGCSDVFVRDRLTGTTERVSVDSSGLQADLESGAPMLCSDGHLIAFSSGATNLVPGDTNAAYDVFVHDMSAGTTERVSLSATGAQGNSDAGASSISADGSWIAFESLASNLVAGDTNGKYDVFARNMQSGAVTRVSVATSGTQGDGDSILPLISGDGRFIAFTSAATNIVPGDNNGYLDVFVHEVQTSATTLASVSIGGTVGNRGSQEASLSFDGRFVSFCSAATDLVPNGPSLALYRIFVRDLRAGTTELVSSATDGTLPSSAACDHHCMSSDGRYIAFRSLATDLVPGDTNGYTDVFVHDRLAAGFASLCHPGLDGVMACPCANPPASAGRGCDNSSSSGGAQLSASGNAYLSIDSLTLATRDERPSATSIVLQGDAPVQGGSAFGQGVRCVGGTMKRLYVKTAANGSITAPELAMGDAPISIRSAQLGTQLAPGQPYFYLVYYRDPVVLGGCAASSTFNATQTCSIGWWP